MTADFTRMEKLIGNRAERLYNAHVAVIGLGGVGGALFIALARMGIGKLTAIDGDVFSPSNVNRQTGAAMSTIGRSKAQILAEMARDINPGCDVRVVNRFYTHDSAAEFDFSDVDFIADACDMVSAKLALAERAAKENIPMISCLGTGNKLDPTRLEIADIYKTSVCPLARVMRRELKARGIEKLTCVYSKEPPMEHAVKGDERTPGSVSFVPPAAGLIMASHIFHKLV